MCSKAFIRIQIHAGRTQRDYIRLDIIRVIAEVLPYSSTRVLAKLGVNSRECGIFARHSVAEYEKVAQTGVCPVQFLPRGGWIEEGVLGREELLLEAGVR